MSRAHVVAIALGMAMTAYGCVDWFKAKGPLGPGDLPSSWICVEFLIGSPPVAGSAFCAGTTEEVLAEQDRRLRADPRIVGVRAVRQ
jgi:hypothetical protein